MTFKEIMTDLKNQKIALYLESEQDVDELVYLAHEYPENNVVDMCDGKGSFSDYVEGAYAKFSHHVYFYGSLDFIGSVATLRYYGFNYPIVYWHDVIEVERKSELDKTQYFEILTT